ncbi:SLC13 family permease [Halomarina pelagica]|uniref:SLC13 family permease n=1 Tax=Halomarina pelagica TaxID=2961599 RepID=UPI0021156A77
MLAVRRVRGYPLDRPTTAAGGAVLVLAIGAISTERALAAVDAGTLLLLFGMMVHVEALALSGFYGWCAARLVALAGTVRRLTLGTLVLASVLSAIALNDAVVLLLTPILLRALAETDTEVDVVPTLLAVVLGANVGSVATPLGNPQNAYVLSRSGLSAAEFIAALAPVAAVALVVAALALVPFTPRGLTLAPVDAPAFDRTGAAASLCFLGATLTVLVVRPDLDPGAVAASLGVAHVAWLQATRQIPGDVVLDGIDWGLLVLFTGMFVLVGALEGTVVTDALARVGGGFELAAATFVLSNLVSNVPAVVLLSTAVSTPDGWLVLAAVSTLAGNATPIASAATLIVLEQASGADVEIPVLRVVLVGTPVALATTLVAVLMLSP